MLLFSEAFQRNSVRRYLPPISYSYYLHGKAEMEDQWSHHRLNGRLDNIAVSRFDFSPVGGAFTVGHLV